MADQEDRRNSAGPVASSDFKAYDYGGMAVVAKEIDDMTMIIVQVRQ